ncbi:hypothetical protein OIU77_007073 [Salix suchowensis]|uniref:HMA domain-containing protein n=1 Tax=Salix suchowensis TaxID=1278906 RepID=A0ABQ9AMV3_9ROSI|nr:hypothetical protein OIU77_007073 [Salix suchowensis]
MNCEKCRIKTLRVMSDADGVSSVGFEGENKQNVVVIGDFDAQGLVRRLRKKVGHTDIISIGPVKEKYSTRSSDGEGIAYGIWLHNLKWKTPLKRFKKTTKDLLLRSKEATRAIALLT